MPPYQVAAQLIYPTSHKPNKHWQKQKMPVCQNVTLSDADRAEDMLLMVDLRRCNAPSARLGSAGWPEACSPFSAFPAVTLASVNGQYSKAEPHVCSVL